MCCYCNTQTRTKAQIQWGHIFFHMGLWSARVPLLAAQSTSCGSIKVWNRNHDSAEQSEIQLKGRRRMYVPECEHFPIVPEHTGVLSRCCWALNRPGRCRTTNPHDLNISCPSLHLAVFFYTILFSFLPSSACVFREVPPKPHAP